MVFLCVDLISQSYYFFVCLLPLASSNVHVLLLSLQAYVLSPWMDANTVFKDISSNPDMAFKQPVGRDLCRIPSFLVKAVQEFKALVEVRISILIGLLMANTTQLTWFQPIQKTKPTMVELEWQIDVVILSTWPNRQSFVPSELCHCWLEAAQTPKQNKQAIFFRINEIKL